MIVVLFPAPVFLGYPVLYFKLSEKVIASKRDRVKVRNIILNPKKYLHYICTVAAEHPLAGGAVRVREPGDHPRVLPLPGQERQDHARPRQGEQGPAADRRRGQGRGQPLPPHQVVFSNFDMYRWR